MPGPLDRGWGAVVVVASGPSFSVEQAELIAAARAADRCHVIVVNDGYRRVPSADVLYACDWSWWQLHLEAVRESFRGELWTQFDEVFIQRCAQARRRYLDAGAAGLRFARLVPGNALLPRDDRCISSGSNGGFQALMLARLFGALRILLVGYDMQRTGGKEHWFGAHPGKLANGDPRSFITHFEAIAAPLRAERTEVINCSAATALRCFPRADLAASLAAL